MTEIEHVKWDHLAQRSVIKRRREIRAQRQASGELRKPRRAWRKGRGIRAANPVWSPFDKDGNLDTLRLRDEGWVTLGALKEGEGIQ